MLPRLDFIAVLILFGVLQTVALSIIFLSRGVRTVPWLAGCSLFVLGIIEMESFLNYSGLIIHAPWMINISPPLILLLGPLNLFLARTIYPPSVQPRFIVLHLVPAIAFFAYSLFFFLQPVDFKVYAVMKSMHPEPIQQIIKPSFLTDPLNIRGIVVVEGLALHLMTYSVALFLFVRKKEKASLSAAVRIYRSWLKFSTTFLLAGSLIFLMTGGVVNGKVLFHPLLPGFATDLFCVLMAYAGTIFWIVQAHPARSVKYFKSGLDDQFRKLKLETLLQIMENEKPYRSPEFSLGQLARLVGLTPHQVSEVINHGKGMTFAELVNHYRIREATHILDSPEGGTLKVENIAYDLGYKSKSAFFASFKRQMQTTPAEYRRSRSGSPR